MEDELPLRLTKVELTDIDFLFELFNDPTLLRYDTSMHCAVSRSVIERDFEHMFHRSGWE